MKNAILIHGMPEKEEYFNPDLFPSSHGHWLPWLQQQLIIRGIPTQTPEMPEAYKPNYETWSSVFEQFFIYQHSLLVGHSCGAGFLLRWLSDHQTRVGKLYLVAPWLDPHRTDTKDFFQFAIDPSLPKRVKEIHLLFSINDSVEGVLESVELITQFLPMIHVHKFPNYGHFTSEDMKTEKFPELLELILKS